MVARFVFGDRRPYWTDGYLQGIVDVPYLNLTSATRAGVIHDAALEAFAEALSPLEARLLELIAEHRRAEEERMSRDTLRSIQRAFREALLTLPSEEYEWFDCGKLSGAAACCALEVRTLRPLRFPFKANRASLVDVLSDTTYSMIQT